MEHEKKLINGKSFYIFGLIMVLAVIAFMACSLFEINLQANSLKNEMLLYLNEVARGERDAQDTLSTQLTVDLQQKIETPNSESVFSAKEILYEAREYNGKIAILTAKDGTITEILDVYVFTLPENDKADLNSGIPLYSETELLSIIQDYTS